MFYRERGRQLWHLVFSHQEEMLQIMLRAFVGR